MSYVLGCDFSTLHIDYVLLDETTNEAAWSRYTPAGESAQERLRNLPAILPSTSFYDGCYIAAVEVPYGRNQPGTSAKLNRVFGAVLACIPQCLEVWAVTPTEWRQELGLPGNASKDECAKAVRRLMFDTAPGGFGYVDWPQDALDAYAIALYARETNRRAIEAAA